jgi:hypothetical protein
MGLVFGRMVPSLTMTASQMTRRRKRAISVYLYLPRAILRGHDRAGHLRSL